jgi:hypothetical protein
VPDINNIVDVTNDDLSPEQQVQLKDAIDQFQQKCLMSFGKNRSGVSYLKSDMPRVLLPGELDSTAAQEKQEVLNAFRETMDNVMVKHHTAFLTMFKQMMVGVFGLGMERMLNRVSPQTSTVEVGETNFAQLARDASTQPTLQGQPIQPPPQSIGSQPVQPPLQSMGSQLVQPPLQSNGGHPVQQPNPYQANRPTYGDLSFGSSGMPPNSTYKNMYGGAYSEVMDYGAIDAFPNPGYGTAAGMQDPNDDVLVQKMADVLQNQFGLKPKMQGPTYTPPLPE